jgi:hypothetical protein
MLAEVLDFCVRPREDEGLVAVIFPANNERRASVRTACLEDLAVPGRAAEVRVTDHDPVAGLGMHGPPPFGEVITWRLSAYSKRLDQGRSARR